MFRAFPDVCRGPNVYYEKKLFFLHVLNITATLCYIEL